MLRFVDVHAHILPGIDDGPPSLAETIRMLHVAFKGGTRTVIATPHMFLPAYDNDSKRVIDTFTHVMEELHKCGADPRFPFLQKMSLSLGSENFLSPELFEALDSRRVVTLSGGFYLLVEFSSFLPFEMVASGLHRILKAGFLPVLAHVERYPLFAENPHRLADLLDMGCIAQVNGSSLCDPRNRQLRKATLALLGHGLVQVIASDGHGSRQRPPDLAPACSVLKKKFTDDKITAWMVDNPMRILDNKSLG